MTCMGRILRLHYSLDNDHTLICLSMMTVTTPKSKAEMHSFTNTHTRQYVVDVTWKPRLQDTCT